MATWYCEFLLLLCIVVVPRRLLGSPTYDTSIATGTLEDEPHTATDTIAPLTIQHSKRILASNTQSLDSDTESDTHWIPSINDYNSKNDRETTDVKLDNTRISITLGKEIPKSTNVNERRDGIIKPYLSTRSSTRHSTDAPSFIAKHSLLDTNTLTKTDNRKAQTQMHAHSPGLFVIRKRSASRNDIPVTKDILATDLETIETQRHNDCNNQASSNYTINATLFSDAFYSKFDSVVERVKQTAMSIDTLFSVCSLSIDPTNEESFTPFERFTKDLVKSDPLMHSSAIAFTTRLDSKCLYSLHTDSTKPTHLSPNTCDTYTWFRKHKDTFSSNPQPAECDDIWGARVCNRNSVSRDTTEGWSAEFSCLDSSPGWRLTYSVPLFACHDNKESIFR